MGKSGAPLSDRNAVKQGFCSGVLVEMTIFDNKAINCIFDIMIFLATKNGF